MMGWFLFLEGPSLELEAESSADWKNQRKPQKASATGQTSSASLPLLRRAQLGLCFASFVSKMWLMEFIFLVFFLFHWSSTRDIIIWTDCLLSQSTNSGSVSNFVLQISGETVGDIGEGPGPSPKMLVQSFM